MKRQNKKILLFVSLGLVLVVSMLFVLNNKNPEYKELPKVKLKESLNNKQFALMLEQDNGEYKESEGELPTEGYVFNKEKSGCTDVNGKIINDVLDYDYENYIVLLDTSKTSYCYLYYDIEPNISYLRSKDADNHLTTELTGGMYRYQGLYTDDVRNYICLGENCCSTEECSADTNDSMYRIIGINAKGELKVIKKTALSQRIKWHTTELINTKWPDSDLFHRLNDNENGTYKDNSFYNGLNQNLKNIIIKKDWLYGDFNDLSNDFYNGNYMYKIETGNSLSPQRLKNENDDGFTDRTYIWDKENDKINSYIGLLYLHDYLYAYPNGNPGRYNGLNSWIHVINNEKNPPDEIVSDNGYETWEWLLTRYGYGYNSLNRYSIRYINSNGGLFEISSTAFLVVRPVFYLSNEIELSGKGTLSEPFRISGVG